MPDSDTDDSINLILKDNTSNVCRKQVKFSTLGERTQVTNDNNKTKIVSSSYVGFRHDDDSLSKVHPRTCSKNVAEKSGNAVPPQMMLESVEILSSDDDDAPPFSSVGINLTNNRSLFTAHCGTKKGVSAESDSDDSMNAFREALKPKGLNIADNLFSMKVASTKSTTTKFRKEKSGVASEKKFLQEERKRKAELAKLEKEAAKEQRAQERRDKTEAALKTKDTRKQMRVESQQVSGKLAKNEIAVLMERTLFHDDIFSSLNVSLNESGYAVHEYASALGCNAIQWVRKDAVLGGAQSAIEGLQAGDTNEYQHLPVVAIISDNPRNFIKLLKRSEHDEDDDYPELESWILGIEYGWRAAWKSNLEAEQNHSTTKKHGNQSTSSPVQRPRIILFLYNVLDTLDGEWIQYRKKSKSARASDECPPTAAELHDAITWMLIQFQVECVCCATIEELSHDLKKMTRMLAEEPYQKQVTELDCIRKLKAECSDFDPSFDRSKDCWIRQLQQIPRVSLSVATHLACHFPTAMSLWQAYQDDSLTDQQKRLLLADKLSSQSRQAKLSEWIYCVLTSDNPDELLG